MIIIRVSVVAAVALLCACSSTQVWQPGEQMYKSGNYQEAYGSFKKCASSGDGTCMAYVGFMIEQRKVTSAKPTDDAVGWYTLAARHGNGWARTRLTELGRPVPSADLVPASNSGTLCVPTLGMMYCQ